MDYYHVVCRDCDLESVLEDRAAAMSLWERHGAEADHRVRYAELHADEDEIGDRVPAVGEASQ